MKKFILLALICSSCTSINFTAMSIQGTNNKKLPTLNLELDEYSLLNAYSISQTSGSYSKSQYNEVTTLDPRVQDTKMLIEKETFTNICGEFGEAVGYIEYGLPIVNKSENSIGLLLSVCMFFVPSLLGVTQFVFKIQVEITTKIYDMNHNLIAKYSSSGVGKEKAKLYGYSAEAARRLANVEAVKMALKQNNDKILADFDNISKGLLSN